MLISTEFPPNYEQIRTRFQLDKFIAGGAKPVFAYSPFIHNPFRNSLAPEIIAHERVHISRQGGRPEVWWDQYLASEDFRMAEELLSHVAEYLVGCQRAKNRNDRRRIFDYIAGRLVAPMYGYNPPISFERGRWLLKMALKEDARLAKREREVSAPMTIANPNQP
jgi:hypothetical protein